MDAISPFWDGNETWLVVIGASLFAAFPVVYAVFLPAFYIPVLLLLFGLIFRGVAFEFRYRGSARGLWDWGFFLGSTVVAFVQGAAVGAMIRGIPVVNGQFAGGPFEWLAPLPVLHGIGLVLGYALLGAGLARAEVRGQTARLGMAEGVSDWPSPCSSVLALATVRMRSPSRIACRAVFLGRPWGLAVSGDRPAGDVRRLRRCAAPPRRAGPSR